MSSNHRDTASRGSHITHHGHRDPTRTAAFIDTFHIDTFEQRPATAANVLRDVLEMRQCDMLESFLSATPRGDSLNARQFEVLRSSGFLIALADALIAVITPERCPRHKNAGGELVTAVSCQDYLIGLSMTHLRIYTSTIYGLKRDMKTRLFCDRLAQVCKCIWNHRNTLFDPNVMGDTKRHLEYASDIVQNLNQIWCFFHNKASPPLSTFMPHVAMYCWFNCEATCAETWKLAGLIGCTVMGSPEPERSLFWKETIPESIGQRSPADAYWALLSNPNLELAGLANHIEVIRFCAYHGPPLGELSGNRSLLRALAKAAQKYFCRENASVGFEDPVGRVTIAFIGMLHERYAEDTTSEIMHNLCDLHFLPAISNTLVWSVENLDKDSMQPLASHIHLLTKFGQWYLNDRHSTDTPRSVVNANIRIRHALRIYWIPLLDGLRAALSRQRRVRGADPNVRYFLEKFVQTWLDCGRAYELEEGTERQIDGAAEDLGSGAFERWRGCFYEKCVCYGRTPLHGARRVCKGCWRTYYCGKNCQKKDWSAGHRYVCVGRRERSTQ